MKIGVVFGGQSVEHDISILTGLELLKTINQEKYDLVPIYLTKDGKWLTGKSLTELETYRQNEFEGTDEFFFSARSGDGKMYANPNKRKFFGKKVLGEIDLIFNALHGNYGEDGSIQGLFEMMNIPYIGSGVDSSGISMDKIIMKDIYKANGLPLVNDYWFYRRVWNTTNKRALLADIEKDLDYPIIVKPSNLGSRIGASLVEDREELEKAIDLAASYDRKILLEEAIKDVRMISCFVLGRDEDLKVSPCQEILAFDYQEDLEERYLATRLADLDKNSETRIEIPAKITNNIKNKIETLAKRAFSSIDASGIARVDLLMDDMHNIYVSEINTLPWTMGLDMCQHMGQSKDKLINSLINIAINRNKERNKNIYKIDSNLLFKLDLEDEKD